MVERVIEVTVKNTSNTTYTFWVGATVSQAISGSGCNIWIPSGSYFDLPLQSATISPGSTYTFTWFVDDGQLGSSTQYIISKVWKNSNPRPQDCITGSYISFSPIQKNPQITRIDFPNPSELNPQITVGSTLNIDVKWTYVNPVPSNSKLAYGVIAYGYDPGTGQIGASFNIRFGGLYYNGVNQIRMPSYFISNPSLGYSWTSTISFTPLNHGIFNIAVLSGYTFTGSDFTWMDIRPLWFEA